jgi:hypothetical protein
MVRQAAVSRWTRVRGYTAAEIQRGILDNHYLVPVFRHAFMHAIGPRIAADRWQDVFPTIATGYAHPWEDIRLKQGRSARDRQWGRPR